MSTRCDTYKVGIVGCGKVGMSAAYALVLDGLVNQLVLISRSKDKVYGEQLDLEHGLAFLDHVDILATDDYAELAGSDVVVLTAGAAQRPGDTRLDLAVRNKQVIEELLPQILRHAPNAVILIVSNPVDILTYHAYKIAGLPKGQIFGSGTALDTARFRFHLSEFLKVNPKSIHAYILGEHGDHSFPVTSSATVGGQPLNAFENYTPEKVIKAYDQAKRAAYTIIQSKGATYYAIGVVIRHLVNIILRDTKSVLPVSIPLHQYYGHNGVALSVPCVIGRSGVEQVLDIKLSWEERQKLDSAVTTLKEFI